MSTIPTILELSRKYSPKNFSYGMIMLGCAFCDAATEIGIRTLINNGPGEYGVLMACSEHEKDAHTEALVDVASRAAMPPEIVRGMKVTISGKEYKLIHMRVSRSLRPNEIIFLVKGDEGRYNRFFDDMDNPDTLIKQIKENIENYDNPHYPEEMKQAFLRKMENYLAEVEKEVMDDLMEVEEETITRSPKRGSPDTERDGQADEMTPPPKTPSPTEYNF